MVKNVSTLLVTVTMQPQLTVNRMVVALVVENVLRLVTWFRTKVNFIIARMVDYS